MTDQFGQLPDGAFTIVAKDATTAGSPAGRGARRRRLQGGRVAAVQPVTSDLQTALIVSQLERAESKAYTDDLRAAPCASLDAEQVWVTGARRSSTTSTRCSPTT